MCLLVNLKWTEGLIKIIFKKTHGNMATYNKQQTSSLICSFFPGSNMQLYMESNVLRSDHMTSRQLKQIPFIVYFYLTSKVLEFHFNQIGVRQEVYITAAKATLTIGNITLVLLCFIWERLSKICRCQLSAEQFSSSVLHLAEHEYLLPALWFTASLQIKLIYLL